MTTRRWFTFWKAGISSVPSIPGVYVAFDDGVVAYVGQSDRLGDRLKSHEKFDLMTGVVKIKVRFDNKLGERLMRECRLIHRLKPPLNLVGHPEARIRRGPSGLRRVVPSEDLADL